MDDYKPHYTIDQLREMWESGCGTQLELTQAVEDLLHERKTLRAQLVALSAEANKLCGLLGITDDRPTTDALRAAYKEAQARAHAVAVAVLPELTEAEESALAEKLCFEGSVGDRMAVSLIWQEARSRIRTIGQDHVVVGREELEALRSRHARRNLKFCKVMVAWGESLLERTPVDIPRRSLLVRNNRRYRQHLDALRKAAPEGVAK